MDLSVPASLLFPVGATDCAVSLPEITFADLELDFLVSELSAGGPYRRRFHDFLTNLPVDPGVIRRRQDVFRDVMESPDLRSVLEGFLPLGHELNYFTEVHKEQSSPFMQAVWRLGELEIYVDAITYLESGLSGLPTTPRSKPLQELAASVRERRADPDFVRLADELPRLRAGLRSKKSVTLGVNLDHRLRPIEAGIISVNEKPIQEQTLVSRLFGGASESIRSVVPIRSTPMPAESRESMGSTFPLAPLFEDLETVLKSAAKGLARGLKRYSSLNAAFLSQLREEFGFLLSVARVFENLKNAGLPVCFPEITFQATRSLQASDFYNPVLALRKRADALSGPEDRIIRNDVSLTPNDGIQLVTGPNRGGKTTYLQGLGLMQVLAQAGLPVAASSAQVSPVDAVLTHFPVREDGGAEAGRLGEEANRLSDVFDTITGHSLVLLNESLASTSPAESEYLAEDVVRGLRMFGARAAYSTHLHGLAARVDELNQTNGTTTVVSLVSRVDRQDGSARRTFIIERDTPAGTSFAADIARSAGIDLAQLEERRDDRRRQPATNESNPSPASPS